MAHLFVSSKTGNAPSPKPRNIQLSVSKLAASFEQQSTDKPQPIPRRKSDRSPEDKVVLPDYVNDTEVVKTRSATLATRRLAPQQDSTSQSPSQSAAKHILQTSRSRLGSEGDGGSSDEEGRPYINCSPQDLAQQRRPRAAEAAVNTVCGQPPRRPVQQVGVETSAENGCREMDELYMNCPDSQETPESPGHDDEGDFTEYVEMNPTPSRRLLIQRDEATDAYIKMNPAPRRASQGQCSRKCSRCMQPICLFVCSCNSMVPKAL